MSLQWIGFSKVDPDLLKVADDEPIEKYTRRQKAALHVAMIATSRENSQLKVLVLILCLVIFFLCISNEQYKIDARLGRLVGL